MKRFFAGFFEPEHFFFMVIMLLPSILFWVLFFLSQLELSLFQNSPTHPAIHCPIDGEYTRTLNEVGGKLFVKCKRPTCGYMGWSHTLWAINHYLYVSTDDGFGAWVERGGEYNRGRGSTEQYRQMYRVF